MVARVWLLNLDADLELGTAGPYTPSDRVKRAAEGARRVIRASLVPEGDFVVEDASADGAFRGVPARCFCPTENARRELRRLGAVLPDAPSGDVLRRVARRELGYVGELPGAFFSDDVARVLEAIVSPPPLGDGWRLKRAYGMASRGHRVVRGAPTEADRAFVRASTDGLIVEPNVRIETELGLHGYLAVDGTFVRGELTRQTMDAYGAWRETHRALADEASVEVRAALDASLERAARALHTAGYFGPFGIDAFTYAHEGQLRLRASSEIHARYSMGWAFGFERLERPDL